jgi:peptidoglycan/xylan/chitin deacetylase (PgdA/CDA1 family)
MAAGTLVLLYHRVVDIDRDPYRLAVRPAHFAEHCRILKKRCDVIRLRDLNRTSRQVVITFDDGYADNAHQARSILSTAGLPATFFVTIGRLEQSKEVWWDRLEQILLACKSDAVSIEIELGGRPLWADLRAARARERAHEALYWRLLPLPPSIIEAALDAIENRLGVSSTYRESNRWMSLEELRDLASCEGMDIGAHTLTHPFLSTLAAEEQWREIDGSRRRLERLLGIPVTLFSYPYGGHDAFDEGTARMVRDAGYTAACTVIGGLLGAETDLFRIPRHVVYDWDGDTFEARLDQWLGVTSARSSQLA